ncbi:antirestriction protein ArdA [Youxingia wuxianensis]|uniref:antirestriction protein ArdA n=1 Tax=Youxingia wuxianensis TaxID=2763678 RepID=UPI0037095116
MFRVELSGNKDRCCELELPAAYYSLLDALDKLQMAPGDKPRWGFLEHHSFPFLHVHLAHECDLYQLNALATFLGQMNGRERTAFEGLFNMEVAKKYGPISVATMIDLAYSTDCCHVVNASTDEQLGRFYAENDFIPALEKVPDSIFEYLDFEMLGRKARFEEGGIFASNGYVTQHTELKQVYDSLALIPEVPEYGIRLLAGGPPMDSDGLPEKQVYLNLPATQEALDHVLEMCEAPSWREVVFWAEDGAVPELLESMDCDDIQELNELAKHLKCRENSGELSKLKAVILATDCHDVGTAIQISENLDDYLFEPDQRNPEEVASEELRLIVDEQSLSILKKHVSLYNYGLDVMAANNAVLTPYGLVQRRDGNELLQAQEPPSERSGMEMMQ